MNAPCHSIPPLWNQPCDSKAVVSRKPRRRRPLPVGTSPRARSTGSIVHLPPGGSPVYTDRTMASLTINVDEQVLERARARALADDTTVGALLQEYLTAFAGADDLQSRALADLLQLSAAVTSRRGSASCGRSELHRREAP